MADEEDRIRPERAGIRRLLLALLLVALIGAGLYYYLSGGRYETTDNASLQTGMVGIAADISGRVTSVEVTENQQVSKGQILFRLDAADYQAEVAAAEAEIASGRTSVNAKRADFAQAQAEMGAAQARLDFARREAARQGSLLREGISSKAQVDQAQLAVHTAREAIVAAGARAESVRASLSGSINAPADSQPGVRRARASLTKAQIGLERTIVRAPQDGIVTRVHQLQVGSYVTAARPVFMLTGTKFWIMANFKESQLRHMRLGQPAKIKIDAFPDAKLTGRIASFSPGTGSSMSVLPAENATGNWVKVVQRLPIEIAIDRLPEGLPIHTGLSTEVTVDTGHQRRLFGPDVPAKAGKK